MKPIKISDYFKIINPHYIIYQLTPVRSCRNNESDKIIKAVSGMYKSLLDRVNRKGKQLFYYSPAKVSYYIYMERENVRFYFIVPDQYENLLLDKVGSTWKGITIDKVDTIPDFDNSAVKRFLTYKKEDALSLATDKRSNVLLSSVLSTLDVMQEGDRVGVFYNFAPTDPVGWRAQYDNTINKLKSGDPIDRNKFGAGYVLKLMFNIIAHTLELIASSFFLMKPDDTPKYDIQLLPETKRKRDVRICETQILCFSDSESHQRALNNAMSVCESFKSVTGDNELVYKSFSGKFNPTTLYINGADRIKISPEEGQSLLCLPGYDLLKEHKNIKCIDVLETPVPLELQAGTICVGTCTCKGNAVKAYLTTDNEYQYLTVVILGPTRAGKTNLIAHISLDTVSAGQCTILFDFCKKCELSDAVSNALRIKFPDTQILNIDCKDYSKLQGLGYNEVNIDSSNLMERYDNAKRQAAQLNALINSIASKETSDRMDRFLKSAAIVTFTHTSSINQVFECLQSRTARNKAISLIPDELKELMQEYINNLHELDDEKKDTKTYLISGVLDRITSLKDNTPMELMLKKDCSENFNLIEEIQKSQLICLRIPDAIFTTDEEKDTFCTYWISKIWLALRLRGDSIPDDKCTKLNIVIDELYQVPHCQEFLTKKISQIAKFKAQIFISAHYLNQISIIREELRSANTSFMMIAGCDKENYREMSDELKPYTVEDLLSLKRYHSLNYLKTNDGYAKFVTELPKKIT